MNNVLGTKRSVILAILVGANAIIGYGWYEMLRSSITDLEAKEKRLTSQVNARRSDLFKLQDEWENINQQVEKYRVVERSGLLDEPNLAISSQILDRHIRDAGILSATWDYGGAVKIRSRKADEVDHVIVSKPITVTVDLAFDDNDIYNLINNVQKRFPGRISFSELNLKRGSPLNVSSLQSISSGSPTGLVKAEYAFDWLTMIHKDRVSQEWLDSQNKVR